MVKRTIGGVLAVVTLALAGLIATTSAAGASPDTPGTADTGEAVADTCVPGEACIVDAYGNVVYSNAGNTGPIWIAPAGGGYVWNNGVRYPGLDHIQLYTSYGGTTLTICLHYGRSPVFVQPDPTAGALFDGEAVTSWRWRGECIGDEDEWHVVG